MTVLKLLWLGSPVIEYDGRPLRLEMRKTLALLAYLSLSPQKPTREILATLFWPEYDQQHALANLRRHLSSLAKILPAGLLESDREKIGLNREEWIKIDVDEFTEQLKNAEKLFQTTDEIVECTSAFETAVAIYKGDFFEGFNLKDCIEFDGWQRFQREGLREEYGRALEKLAEVYQQAEAWDKAIGCARTWLALDRLHEPAYRLLMTLYFLSGQKSAALHQYEECQKVLEQELGQPPEAETLKLHEAIRKETAPEALRTRRRSKINALEETPENFLTRTKFFLPKVPRTILHRPRLVSQLNECVKMPLTLISATAGFGKTTLLAEWAVQSKEKIAWVSVDRSDNDVYRMVDYIVNAIRNVLPGSKTGTVALSLLRAPQPVQVSVIVGSLINDLITIPDRLVLVLDDYHNIDSLAVHEAVNFLLDHRPENLHLIISTRTDPPLSLARLRANILLNDIRTDDLRFTYDETQLFLTRIIGSPLSARDMVFFENKVEGWIAGIQLASLVMRSNDLAQSSSEMHGFIRAFRGSQRHILDYLIEEVLNRQTEEIRKFLLRTSILEKLCFQLCDCLLAGEGFEDHQQIDELVLGEKSSSQQVLEFLERSNLFLLPLDDERKWYRYHHLFADLLHVRLQQHEPKLEAVLHKRAASWYAQNSYPLEAVKHALDSSDYLFAADLIEEYSLKLIWMNQIVTTLDWFKLLPPEVVESRPLLTIYQTFTLARKGEFERVEVILANAEVSLQAMPGSPKTDEYKNLILGMRAFIANLRGQSEKAIQFCLCIPAIIENRFTASYFVISSQLAVAYFDKGDLVSAERVFMNMVKQAEERQDVYYATATNKELIEIWCLRGRLSRAEQVARRMNDWIQEAVQEPALYNGLIKLYEANMLIEKNELETARLLVQEDIENMLSVWSTTSLYFGYTVLGYLYTSLGEFQKAWDAVKKATQWVTSQSMYLRNNSAVLACQVNLWLAEGSLQEAQKWAQSTFPNIPTEFPFIRELNHLCLARVLVASHRWEEALDMLQHLSSEAQAGGRFGRLLKFDILRALTLDGLGRSDEALDLLDACINSAYPEGYMRVFLDEGAPMKALIKRRGKQAKSQDREINDFVNKLLQAF